MLSFFQNIVSASDPGTSNGGGAELSPRSSDHLPKKDENKVKTDDEIAEELLSQFPTYGSNSCGTGGGGGGGVAPKRLGSGSVVGSSASPFPLLGSLSPAGHRATLTKHGGVLGGVADEVGTIITHASTLGEDDDDVWGHESDDEYENDVWGYQWYQAQMAFPNNLGVGGSGMIGRSGSLPSGSRRAFSAATRADFSGAVQPALVPVDFCTAQQLQMNNVTYAKSQAVPSAAASALQPNPSMSAVGRSTSLTSVSSVQSHRGGKSKSSIVAAWDKDEMDLWKDRHRMPHLDEKQNLPTWHEEGHPDGPNYEYLDAPISSGAAACEHFGKMAELRFRMNVSSLDTSRGQVVAGNRVPRYLSQHGVPATSAPKQSDWRGHHANAHTVVARSSPSSPDASVDPKTTRVSATTTKTGGVSAPAVSDDRKHWMPDKLCKHCYSCEVPFTVFRRRHHCRLCGQVFCSNCSAYFVELSPQLGHAFDAAAASPTITGEKTGGCGGSGVNTGATSGSRIRGIGSTTTTKTKITTTTTTTTTEGDGVSGLAQSGGMSGSGNGGNGRQATMRACKMCYDQVSLSAAASTVSARSGGDIGLQGMRVMDESREAPDSIPGRYDEASTAGAIAENVSEMRLNDHGLRRRLENSSSSTAANSSSSSTTGAASSSAFSSRGDRWKRGGLSTTSSASIERERRDELQNCNGSDQRSVASSLKNLESAWNSARSIPDEADLHAAMPRSISNAGHSGDGRDTETIAREHQGAEGGIGCGPQGSEQRCDVDLRDVPISNSFTRLSHSGSDEAGPQPDLGGLVRGGDDGNDLSEQRQKPHSSSWGSQNAGRGEGSACMTTEFANRKVGQIAAQHMERLCVDLLRSDAPLLCKEVEERMVAPMSPTAIDSCSASLSQWVDTIMTLATRCCATVKPNVKGGDLLDIRPYSKVKVIPGGFVSDCAYMSGVIFQKNVNHKSMAREILNPRIMLLSGGIEYTRTENRIASLQTLLEQEEKYMEILVNKIVGLKPDLLLVGRAVSRRAQELLLLANVVLIQHVKPALMSRISRQTGATILSSTDHVMNQFGTSVLGKCKRFRLVSFLCHETWSSSEPSDAQENHRSWQQQRQAQNVSNGNEQRRRDINKLLSDKNLPNHKRQAALAAKYLGQRVVDGAEAVRSGLAKRGVARTYALMEGCPKQLGCTMVLRGASRSALKQAKRVLAFLANVAYNLKLETTYMKERFVTLPADYSIPESSQLHSSSLCVNYGQPPFGRKVRPWNGSQAAGPGGSAGGDSSLLRSISGKVTAFDHQSILITSVWMTERTQCCPAEVKGICYYTRQDVSLGQFLHDSCFNLSLKCQNPTCKKSVLEHTLSFIHCDGMINITVENMDDPLPPAPLDGSNTDKQSSSKGSSEKSGSGGGGGGGSTGKQPYYSPIATWTYCNNCGKVVTPLVFISEDTFNFSFGKFLEVYFYDRDAIINSPSHGCCCPMQTAATLYFGCGRLATRFTYETVRPYGVYVRRSLTFDESFHREDSLRHLELLSTLSSALFVRFDKHIEKVSREARQLFGSAANKPEHLQTVLSELNTIGSEVDHAAKTLQEKIAAITNSCLSKAAASAGAASSSSTSSSPSDLLSSSSLHASGSLGTNETLLRFPWHARRYLFLLTSAWNERLSAAGQALAAMKKLGGDVGLGTSGGDGYGNADDVMEGMKRLRQLQKVYSQYDVGDMTIRTDFDERESSRSGANNANSTTPMTISKSGGAALTSSSSYNNENHHHRRMRRRGWNHRHKRIVSDFDYHDYEDGVNEYDEDYDEDDLDFVIDGNHEDMFSDATATIDADVLASRRRLYNAASGETRPGEQVADNHHGSLQSHSDVQGTPRVTKTLGTRRIQSEPSFDEREAQRQHSVGKLTMQNTTSTGGTGATTPSATPTTTTTFTSGGYAYDNLLSREHLQQLGGGLKNTQIGSTSTTSSIAGASSRGKTAVTAGGAVKSALTRFFNRLNKDHDPYVVELGELAEGRPALGPGVGGLVVPVFDDQPSTVIAHSLSSHEYDVQFKQFLREGARGHNSNGHGSGDLSDSSTDDGRRSIEDLFVPDTTTTTTSSSLKARTDGNKSHKKVGAQHHGHRRGSSTKTNPSTNNNNVNAAMSERKDIEKRMLVRNKTHIKHTFRECDAKGQTTCKFVCTTYWATQFQAVRQAFFSVSSSTTTAAATTATTASLSCSSDTTSSSSGAGGANPGAVNGGGKAKIPDLSEIESEKSYVRSLFETHSWATSGGKSGASFARTADGRFVVKFISRTELQMFLDCAPAYFEYLSKAFFHGLPTVLCKIVGVYQIGYHNRETGKRTMEQVAVMPDIFYGRKISKTFDLKGSLRGRFAKLKETTSATASTNDGTSSDYNNNRNSEESKTPSKKASRRDRDRGDSSESDSYEDQSIASESTAAGGGDGQNNNTNKYADHQRGGDAAEGISNTSGSNRDESAGTTLLDGDFLEMTGGRPLPLSDRAKAIFHMSILNDTLFLSIINVLDYSILVGIDEERMELVVGIIDYFRQYDILKQMERVGKSIPMVVGSEAPTIIQPPLYKARFTNAMERYFMTVPTKWTTI